MLDGADPCQGQEEAKVIGKVGVSAGDRLAGGKVFSLKIGAIGGQHEFRLGLGGGGTGFELRKGRCDFPCPADFQMNVVGLKNAAQVGLVGRSALQALDGGRLVSKSEQESEREFFGVEWKLGQCRYGFFNLNSIHACFPLVVVLF